MSSAKKDEIELAPNSGVDELPDLGSFCTVITSIQGLQERLDELTVADISDALSQARLLTSHLATIEQKLARFLEIRKCLTAVPSVIQNCIDENALETDTQVHDAGKTSQPSNLIQFPLQNTVLKASASRLLRDVSHSPGTSDRKPDLSSPLTPITNKQAAELKLEDDGQLVNSASPDVSNNVLEAQKPKGLEGDITSASAVMPHDEAPITTHVDAISPTTRAERISGDAKSLSQSNLTASGRTAPRTANEAVDDSSKASTTPDSHFDQRLLDDLIKNYGEFAFSQTATSKPEVLDAIPCMGDEISVPEVTIAPEVQPEANLPSVRNNSDLDRELKKIIKDYGEYDLYSHHNPIKLRTGVLAAFIFLALIFSGFYYFSPSILGSQTAESTTASRADTSTSGVGQSNAARKLPSPSTATITHATNDHSAPKNNTHGGMK